MLDRLRKQKRRKAEMKDKMEMQNQTQVNSGLNHSKLKEITNATNTSVVTMLLLALRERARGYSNVTSTKEQLIRMGEKIVDEDYVKFWQDLEAAGIGNFIAGRRGNPDRFKWHYSLRAIARVAIEGKDAEVTALAKKKEEVTPMRKPQVSKRKRAAKRARKPRLVAAAPKAERRLVSVLLNGGSLAEVILPQNASKGDIEAVCQALMA